MNLHTERGISLTEVVVASIIGFVVIVGIGSIDLTRFRIAHKIREPGASDAAIEQLRAALATVTIARNMQMADRFNFHLNPGVFQVRTPVLTQNDPVRCPASAVTSCAGDSPPACCFDIPANYRWDEYALRLTGTNNTGDLLQYTDIRNPVNGSVQCGNSTVLASQISSFSLVYKDDAKAPPAGEPGFIPPEFAPLGPVDDNVASFTIRWCNTTETGDPAQCEPSDPAQSFVGEVTSRAGTYTDVATGLQDPSLGDVISPPPSGRCGT